MKFCPDEPLDIEESQVLAEVDRIPSTQPQASTPGPALHLWPGLPVASPVVRARAPAIIVQNTFIHAVLPPLTPLPGTRPRAQTAPADMGSDRDDWEASCNALSFQAKSLHDAEAETTEGSCDGDTEASCEEAVTDSDDSPLSPGFWRMKPPSPTKASGLSSTKLAADHLRLQARSLLRTRAMHSVFCIQAADDL